MKWLACLICIIATLPLFSQDTICLYALEGVVTDCEEGKPIENIIIKLTGSDGTYFERKTDKAGYYKFDHVGMKYRHINRNTSYIIETSAGDVKTYIASLEKGKLTTIGLAAADCNKVYKKDFCLKSSVIINYFPEFLLKHNMYKTDTTSCINCMDSIIFLKEFLEDNSIIGVELIGYSVPGEKDTLILSSKRAESIRNKLINMGVNKNRIIAKGKGCDFYRWAQTVKTGYPANRLKSAKQYGLVIISITSWNYTIEKSSPPPKRD